MGRIPVRHSTLVLVLLGAGLLLALVVTVAAAAQPPPSSSHTPTPSSPPIPLPDPVWRIPITADGLYRLSYETLADAGVPVSGTLPSAFHLLWRGQEVALQEVGTEDTSLDPGDAFLFYAQKFHGAVQDELYTDENVYWLAVYTTTPGLQMGTRSVAPGGSGRPMEWYTATVHAEENLRYWARYSDAPGTDDIWFWEYASTAGTTTRTYPITLTDLSPGTYTAVLTVELAGYTANPHHLLFRLNGALVGETTWTGQVGHVATMPFTSTAMQEGRNTLSVVLDGPQGVYFNWFEIQYRRLPVSQDGALCLATPLSGTAALTLTGFSSATIQLYDVTRPLTPTRLVGGAAVLSGTSYALVISDTAPAGTAYLAVAEDGVAEILSPTIYHPPADLISPPTGADEIIIAPAEFITAIQPLADQRRSQGLRVRVVDVEDTYALFNGGIFHPQAIRAFVAHAYDNWPDPPPAYLLLVGDGNFNFKGYNPELYGEFVPSLIPPYMEFADPDLGNVAVDSRFGDMDEDGMPELMVGRIPADSVTRVEGVVAKILTYESAPRAPWMERVLLVADDGKVEPEGFASVLDDLAEDFVPTTMETRKVYLEDYCDAPAIGTPCVSATLALTQAWNRGALLLAYAGHAAVNFWANEPLLLNTQLAELTGTVGLPFVLSLDCYDGYWMYPPKYHADPDRDNRSIGEWATTVLTDRGAIAVFGPAGLGYIGLEEQMVRPMVQAMFEGRVYRLGPLTQVGREAVAGMYLARTYTLLGDPAMQLAVPTRYIYLPVVLKSY